MLLICFRSAKWVPDRKIGWTVGSGTFWSKMTILDLVLGRPLSSAEDKDERVGSFAGVSVFGLDALSSAAYGPEAALTILIPLGVAGLRFSLPITIAVSSILAIVYFSYRQTISAYPNGAGTYTVAKENLGRRVGLLGAVALLIDYTLNVAVGISAGIGALISAMPFLQPYTVALCLAVLFLLTFMNLRGIRESGFAFMPPTYMFVGCLGIVIIIGIYKTLAAGGHPQPAAPLPAATAGKEQITWWIFFKAFAAGCTAMTGVEAVSNGVQAFKEPVVNSARRTLAIIVAILILILLGVAYLVSAYGITATEPGTPNYQSILSLLAAVVVHPLPCDENHGRAKLCLSGGRPLALPGASLTPDSACKPDDRSSGGNLLMVISPTRQLTTQYDERGFRIADSFCFLPVLAV